MSNNKSEMQNQIIYLLYETIIIYIIIYRESENFLRSACIEVERTKPSRKVLYHFAIVAIVNELLIKQNSYFARPTAEYRQARGSARRNRTA